MSEYNFNLNQNLDELQHMANALERYVRQDQLYYNLGNHLPRMTLGGFLMRLRRLQQLTDDMSDEQVRVLHDIKAMNKEALQEWHYHYSKKLLEEAQSRLKVISHFLVDCHESPARCRNYYRPEALRRTIVQELLNVIKQLNVVDDLHVEKQVKELDKRLHPVLESTDFIWDDMLQSVYSEEEYWWLYAQPVQEANTAT